MYRKISWIFVVLFFVFCAGTAQGQSRFYHLEGDTVRGKSPIYYYDWWPTLDSAGLIADSSARIFFSDGYMRHYTADTIKIIGIASTMSYVNIADQPNIYEDYDATYDTSQYYILFSDNPSGPVELARVCWTDDYPTHPKRYMELPCTGSNNKCERFYPTRYLTPLREYYFDSAIAVIGSFYLGWQREYRILSATDTNGIHFLQYSVCHISQSGVMAPNDITMDDPCTVVPMQFWMRRDPNSSVWIYQDRNDYSLVFPIIEIDTTLLMPCETPGTPTVTYRDEERVRVEWVDSYNFEWIVSVTTQGGSPESGRMFPSTQPFIDLYGLDGDSAYSVYVKGHCHGEMWSEWSPSCTIDTLTEQTEGIEMIEGPFFTLNPNPAGTTVTVEAAENAEQVEIVDMEGRVVYTQTLSHTATQSLTLDISHLTKGVYLVRLSTPQGVAARKLVVE